MLHKLKITYVLHKLPVFSSSTLFFLDYTCAMHKVGYQSIAATWQDNAIGNQSHTIPTHTIQSYVHYADSNTTLQIYYVLVKKATFHCLLFPMYFQCIFSTQEMVVVNGCIKCNETSALNTSFIFKFG